MKQFKGTKGPWLVDNTERETVVDGKGFSICAVEDVYRILQNWSDTGTRHWSDRKGETFIDIEEEEYKANANLIAAAPELLEALQDVSEILEIFASKAGCQTQSAALKSDAEDFGALLALDRSRDIINKALGDNTPHLTK